MNLRLEKACQLPNRGSVGSGTDGRAMEAYLRGLVCGRMTRRHTPPFSGIQISTAQAACFDSFVRRFAYDDILHGLMSPVTSAALFDAVRDGDSDPRDGSECG